MYANLRKLFSLSVLSLAMTAAVFAQRADRATLTGVVTDPTGQSIPAADVKVKSDDTGVVTDLKTNEAGAYTSPSMVLGNYTVTVESAGFKTAVRAGIRLVGGQTFRQDIALELGSLSDQVTVTATSEILNTTNADVTHGVDSTYYKNLPVVMGADIRLAEALLQLQPGYNPMKPNGDPMFRGSQFQSRLNGGQKSAMENFFDGVAFGYASGHNQSHESAPPIESVGEMKVITSAYSAQYGHSSGGTVEYTSKTGTKDLHGSFYEYFANDKLNARGFFPDRASKQRNNAFGFTMGGPVYIPKVYDGRNKTFFFVNLDYLRFRAGVLPGFGNTTPIDAFKAGDFSSLLTTKAGVDALGRDVFNGMIFDPTSSRTVNGVQIRDPFVGNRIPASMRSNVANQMSALMVKPDRRGTDPSGTAFNVAGNPAGDQTWIGDFRTLVFRVDHQWSDKFKTATSFFWPKRPSIRNCGEVGGCVSQYDPRVSPEKNTDYIGNGFYQRIATQHANQQFDYVIKNNLLYHATASWDRWFMGGTPISGFAGWADKLWGTDKSGLLDKTAGPPNMTFTGNIPYTQIGMQWTGFGFEAINRWQFVNDLTWVKGKHSIKVGYEFRFHQFNFHGWAASTGGSFNFSRLGTGGYDNNNNQLSGTGDPFASFLLGQVQTANFTIPAFTTFNGKFMSTYINDEYKVTSKLNLTLGMRFDYQGPWTERFDRFSTFDSTLPNSAAGGRLGALAFAGTGPGRTGSRTFDKIPIDAFGPRLGFAYRANDKTVIRGGYGIYYAGVTFGQGGTPTTGFTANPTAPNLTNGFAPAFKLDNGFPRELVKLPPGSSDPTLSNGTAPVAYPADGLVQPRYQNWSLTFQRQIGQSMVVEASYIGNHGTRLPHHPQFLGIGYNMNDPKILALGATLLNSDINSPAARAAGIGLPYPGFTGNVAQALRPYPQYQSIEYRDVPIGKSRYSAFQINLDKRFSNGFQFRTFFVRAQLLNDRAESGQRGGGAVQNPLNAQAGEWGLSEDDVPNAFSFTTTYELPIGKNSTGLMAKLLKGWTLNGILRYDSGRPLVITMNSDLGGILFNGVKRPNRVDSTAGVSDLSGYDPAKTSYFNRAGWADPGPLQFGNALARDGSVRGFMNTVEDVSIFKVTTFNDRYRLRFEAQSGNVTNRVVFCDPGITGSTNWNSSSFGAVSLQCNQPRSVQFGLKFEY